ncbi:MAG: CZB domain-containing protein [Acidobacteriaceae bacterium]
MDFGQAITAHSAWKMKLRTYLARPDSSLKVAEVRADDQCELGKWLKNEGRKHAGQQEYAKLVVEHTAFHKAAADVIEKADRGVCVDDEIALGSKSPFASASSSIVSALMAMKAKA